MYDGREIANFILDQCDEKGTPISNLQIQKIIYFCHAWYLVASGKPLIRHNFEAWEFGPVLPYLYRELSIFGDKPVTDRIKKLDRNTGEFVVAQLEMNQELKKYLQEIVDFYGHYSASQLVNLTHEENGPWWKAWHHDSNINPGMLIDNQYISEFYSSKH